MTRRHPAMLWSAFAMTLIHFQSLRADECTPPSSGPDAVVMDVVDTQYWATIGEIAAYTWGSHVLNKGNAPLPWQSQIAIAQNAYRLKDNRFEQIGMSWVKVGTQAATQSTYCNCTPPGSTTILGIGCSDVYDGAFNGSQSILGPRSTVDAFLATMPTLGGTAQNGIERRIQLRVSDIDSALNPGAVYFAELQLISASDANAGNVSNNCAYEPRVAAFHPQFEIWGFTPIGPTVPRLPAIYGWSSIDSTVVVTPINISNEGQFHIASRVSENADETWHYEFAIFNHNSHRSARRFSVPVPSGIAITNIGFHDIAYHSGEPYDGTDWAGVHENGEVTWSTESFDVNPNANALRWGTLYNFRFDADAPPGSIFATLGLFRPGDPNEVLVAIQGPATIVPSLSSGGHVLMGSLIAAAGWYVLHKSGRHV